jgi:glycosyltransferase involved in cell wall biosynthesis
MVVSLMRVLFCPHVEHYTIGLCNELVHGNEVALLHHKNFNLPIKAIIPTNKWAGKLKKLKLYKFWFKNFDIFHCNAPIEAKRAKARRGLILTIHGNPCPELVDDAEEKASCEKVRAQILRVYEEGFPIVAVSKYLATILKELCNVEVNAVIYHGLLDIFMGKKPRKWKDQHVITWISRFVPRKRPFDFLRALSLIKDADFHAVMRGKGALEMRVRQLVGELGLNDKVSIHRANLTFEQLPSIYRHGTIYVHTRPTEPFGFTLLEAMGSGLPVIVPKQGGAAEVAGDACLKFGDVDELADRMLTLMNNPKLYMELSEKAFRRASLFSWKKSANEYLELYKTLGCE